MTKFKLISTERYEDMFDMLPPAAMTPTGFLFGEAVGFRVCTVAGCERTTFSAFAKAGTDHYEALEPMTAAEFRALTPQALTAAPVASDDTAARSAGEAKPVHRAADVVRIDEAAAVLKKYLRGGEERALASRMLSRSKVDVDYATKLLAWLVAGSTIELRALAEPFGDYWKDLDFSNVVDGVDSARLRMSCDTIARPGVVRGGA